jgi:hypothetical protein
MTASFFVIKFFHSQHIQLAIHYEDAAFAVREMAADRMHAKPIVGFRLQCVRVISTFPVSRIF